MAVCRRGGHWSYAFMIDGVRYRGAIPEATTKREAEEVETQVRHSVFEGTYRSPDRRDFEENLGASLISTFIHEVYLPWAIDNKRSWRNDVYRGRSIADYFRKKAFRDITPMTIEKFKRDRLGTATKFGRKRSPNAVNKELQLLSRIFSMAVDNELAATNPCRKVRKFRVEWQRDRYLQHEEEVRLMNALDARYPHVKSIVLVALNTGMRRGEILGMRWDEVDFVRNVFCVRRTKSGKSRFLPMNSIVRQLMLERRAQHPGAEFVFGGPNGRAILDIKHGFGSVLKRAGITDFRFHDLRHTAATRMAEAGVDIRTIAEFLGHATIQMTMRYAHATDDAKRRAASALEAYAFATTPVHVSAPFSGDRQMFATNLPQIVKAAEVAACKSLK